MLYKITEQAKQSLLIEVDMEKLLDKDTKLNFNILIKNDLIEEFLLTYRDSGDKDVYIKLLYKFESSEDKSIMYENFCNAFYYLPTALLSYPEFNFYIELSVISEIVPLRITLINDFNMNILKADFIKQFTLNFDNCILDFKTAEFDELTYDVAYKFIIKTNNCIINIWEKYYDFPTEINDLESYTFKSRDLTLQEILDFFAEGTCYNDIMSKISPFSYHIMAKNNQIHIIKDVSKDYYIESFNGEFVLVSAPKDTNEITHLYTEDSIFINPTELNDDTPYIKYTQSTNTIDIHVPIHDIGNIANHFYLLYIIACSLITKHANKGFTHIAHCIMSHAEKLKEDVLYYPLDNSLQRYINTYKDVDFSLSAGMKHANFSTKLNITGNETEVLNEIDLQTSLLYFRNVRNLEVILENLIFISSPDSASIRNCNIYFYNCNCRLSLITILDMGNRRHINFYNTNAIIWLDIVKRVRFINDTYTETATQSLSLFFHKDENSSLMFLCNDMIMTPSPNITNITCIGTTFLPTTLYFTQLDTLNMPPSILHSEILNNIPYFLPISSTLTPSFSASSTTVQGFDI